MLQSIIPLLHLHPCLPLQGLPFRGLAERLGAVLMPTLQAARAADKQAAVRAKQAAAAAEPVVPTVPSVFPITRW